MAHHQNHRHESSEATSHPWHPRHPRHEGHGPAQNKHDNARAFVFAIVLNAGFVLIKFLLSSSVLDKSE